MTAANPNGPRAVMMRAAAKFKADILASLEACDGMTNAQLCAKLGTEAQPMRARLSRLAIEGYVHARHTAGPGATYLATYHIGPDESGESDISRRIVTEWKPPKIKPDPLMAALYGARKA